MEVQGWNAESQLLSGVIQGGRGTAGLALLCCPASLGCLRDMLRFIKSAFKPLLLKVKFDFFFPIFFLFSRGFPFFILTSP